MLNTIFILEIYNKKNKLIAALPFETYTDAHEVRKRLPKSHKAIIIISESEDIVE